MKTLLLIIFAVMTALPAAASCGAISCHLQPFTRETNYMSLAGYLRYMDFRETGKWMTRQEALVIVKSSVQYCPPEG